MIIEHTYLCNSYADVILDICMSPRWYQILIFTELIDECVLLLCCIGNSGRVLSLLHIYKHSQKGIYSLEDVASTFLTTICTAL